MSLHIEARDGEIADRILLPGDPLRAKYIAETFLEGARCFNRVRNILGYTGTYKGQRVSVMGTGMGIPSISIYVHNETDPRRYMRCHAGRYPASRCSHRPGSDDGLIDYPEYLWPVYQLCSFG